MFKKFRRFCFSLLLLPLFLLLLPIYLIGRHLGWISEDTPDSTQASFRNIFQKSLLYEKKYLQTDKLRDLECAIYYLKKILKDPEFPIQDDSFRLDVLNKSASIYARYYKATKDNNYFDISLDLWKEALGLTSQDTHNLAINLSSLGSALIERYTEKGAMNDLDEGIAVCRRAIALIPYDSVELADYLCDFGSNLLTRYEYTGTLPDLEELIAAYQKAIALSPSDSLTYRYTFIA